jgi:CheY-like chemotaxis protein
MSSSEFNKNLAPEARLEAVDKLTDENQLSEIARTEKSSRIRLAAVNRIQEDILLLQIVKNAQEMDVRLAATERIKSQIMLAEIIKDCKTLELRRACFGRITDYGVLESIAMSTEYSPNARRTAVEKMADEKGDVISKKVLIIDDENDIRIYLQTLLRKAGYETEVAGNGHEGVEKAQSYKPDLITLDIMMPKQSGIKAYQRLRGQSETRDLPIIVLTGLSKQKDFFGGGLVQPEAIMDKPIDQEAFLRKVSELLSD